MCLVACTSRYLPVSHQGNITSDSYALVIIFRTQAMPFTKYYFCFFQRDVSMSHNYRMVCFLWGYHSIPKSCSTFLSLYLSDKLFKVLKLFTCAKICLDIYLLWRTSLFTESYKDCISQKASNGQETSSSHPAGINMEICSPFMEFRSDPRGAGNFQWFWRAVFLILLVYAWQATKWESGTRVPHCSAAAAAAPPLQGPTQLLHLQLLHLSMTQGLWTSYRMWRSASDPLAWGWLHRQESWSHSHCRCCQRQIMGIDQEDNQCTSCSKCASFSKEGFCFDL